MRNSNTLGIVIHKRTLGEKDFSVTLFTPDFGKIIAYARGAKQIKSRFIGHLDLLNICNFQIYKSKNSNLITDCECKKNYQCFRKDLKKFYTGTEIAKIIKNYSKEEENSEEIFELIKSTFDALENIDKEELILESFKIKFFSLIGTMPDLYNLYDTEFENLDLRIKKILQFLLIKPYQEISKLYLNKKDTYSLKNMTEALSDYAL